MQFIVPAPPDMNFHSVIHSHGWPSLAPFSRLENEGVRYTLALPTGRVVTFDMVGAAEGVGVETMADLDADEADAVQSTVRRIFNMDLDLTPFYDWADDTVYEWARERGVGRVLISPTLWEDLVKVLCTTNTTWSQTVSMSARISELGPQGAAGAHAFPAAGTLGAMDPEALNERIRVGYRIKGLHKLATAIDTGATDPEAWRALDADAAFKAVRGLHGFGDYAAGTIMRYLGHYHRISIDTVAREVFAGVHRNGEKAADDKEIAAHYAQHGAWQGLVQWLDHFMFYNDAGRE